MSERRDRTPAQRYRAAWRTLASRQKPGHGVPAYMRWVNRRLARPIAAAAFVARMTPNQVTALSALASAAGLAILILAPQTMLVGLAVAVLLALGFALDSADGQLARLRGDSGPVGEWVDHVVDAVRSPAVHLATGVALWLHGASTWLVLVALIFALTVTTTFLSQILAEQLLANQHEGGAIAAAQPAPGSIRSVLLLPVDTGIICWMFVTWGIPTLFAVTYLLIGIAHLGYLLVTLARKYRTLQIAGGLYA
ncbi:MAG: CDP-alcohol phosphatidyltransferase family protein [Beutenbergiaceae bacterium]